jgi:heptosyltransferase-3
MPERCLRGRRVASFQTVSPVLSQITRGATVAVIRLRSLGDTVLTTPALALLKRHRPDLRVVIVLEKPFDEVVEGNPDVSSVISLEPGAGLWARYEALIAIRRAQPSLCLNLHGGSTSAWLTAFSGARFRAGFEYFRPALAYNVRIPRAQGILGRDENHRDDDDRDENDRDDNRGPDEGHSDNDPVHTAEHHASAMFHLGVPVADTPRAVLDAGRSSREKPYAVLHVSAAYFTKQWPAERFRGVATSIRDKHGLEPVMIAGPGESEILREFSDFESLDGLSIRALKSLLAGARLFVGNDSGPAHIAAAFGVPCVVVFGSSNSAVWRPWQTDHEVVETDWDCKPCPGDRCYAFDQPRCILSVEAEQVENAVGRLLASAKAL